ncbi:hypothetical protein BJ138DRAFT_1016563 [Hygrophoropsis aurantiaca]|uniref:Uncharacterized protein n=1 Tax=Hygrophoropsis aurantiaca TaxID=72124 RepID=A0ACB7ZZU5_9AGAM|nr:hypothetical protein BJ138DRAFT_1016563 [Hygrophoropsis aurantiaca]
MDGVERLQYRFDRRQLEEIKTVVHNSAIEGARKTSTHDCLVAYLITVLNRCMENPIQRVTNVGSYRHVAASFIDPDFAGNAIHVVCTDIHGTLPTDMAGISVAIRESIIRWRDPALLEKWLGTASHLMLEAANTGKAMFFAPREDVLTINSNVLIDWRTIHFGFEQFSSHFTAGVNKFYLRMHKSNPISGVQRFTRDGIDISLGIPRGMKQEVLDLVEGRF